MGLEGGVEVGEGIFGVRILIPLLLDVVLFVFFADGVDPEQNVDHAHLLRIFLRSVVILCFCWLWRGRYEFRGGTREEMAVGLLPPAIPPFLLWGNWWWRRRSEVRR